MQLAFGARARFLSGLRRTEACAAASTMKRMFSSGKIFYTHTDEAPALATYAFLPVVRRFTDPAGIEVELTDISLAGRILCQFPERLTAEQRIADNLSALGELAKTPEANIIKLPNISASVPQLTAAIAELQGKGYDIPDYPAEPSTAEEKEIHATYAKVLGSAVNPVLREGNSDRRVAKPVKDYAKANPHRLGAWDSNCKSHVAHMSDGDYYSSEVSAVMDKATSVRIELEDSKGNVTVLKPEVKLQEGEVIDASFLSVAKLKDFLEAELQKCKEEGLMVSLHMKATMMKVSDPIVFGHAVKVYYKSVFEKYADTFAKLGVNANNGIGDVYSKIESLPESEKSAIEADLMAVYESRPGLAMVNSDKGITNLHVPSDVIIDASMPCVVRDSGKMWNKDDALEDVKCIIPDRCYATMYDAVLDYCRKNGQFDVTTMGNVPNVGLMAQKAEEYGSHDKTFEVPATGTMRVVDSSNDQTVFTHSVEEGDIWRMCQTKDAPIKDWVRLACSRARATGNPAVFWLDANRAHDASLIKKVDAYLPEFKDDGLDIHIMKPVDAVNFSMERATKGQDTISVTGNVLRDYLTDLFPILELGTSAKMLSIVPLLAGGGLFETGAGGSAPKHVQQFVKENHLRWDSLGEYLALAVSLEDLGEKGNEKAKLLGETLNEATGKLLVDKKSPSRKVNELDNRGSTFYIAKYWAEAMAKRDASFSDLADGLASAEAEIVQELIDCQGDGVDIGGYFCPEPANVEKLMRPSEKFNKLIDE